MLTMNLFKRIKDCKRQGLQIRTISRKLNISKNTVKKYYSMSAEEFIKLQEETAQRERCFNPYKDEILSIFKNNDNKVYSSSIYDLMCELYGVDNLPGTERTLRNYIQWLKDSGELSANIETRAYKPVDELPFGQQLQVDFGQLRINTGDTVYIFASVLSASRYKYVAVQKRPFTTLDVILHLIDCFNHIGGIPEEVAIDQDRTMVVSENKGDIVLTKSFREFKDEMGFKLYVCRKADPESKGKVENLVKYVKTSFFSARTFNSFSEVESRIVNWLEKRANSKLCSRTGISFSNLLKIEQEHLKMVKGSIFQRDNILYRESRKANHKSLISVGSSMYSVPIKYRNKQVWIYRSENKLHIYDDLAGKEIAKHNISLMPGQRVISKNHYRDTTKTQVSLKEQAKGYYDLPIWKEYIDKNYRIYNRYFREQYHDLQVFLQSGINDDIMIKALELCHETDQYSVNNFKESYLYYQGIERDSHENILPALITGVKAIKGDKRNPKVLKRNLSYYTSLISILGGIL